MAGLALSGLASGVDTASIVDQLMALDRRSISKLEVSKQRLLARDTGLKDVQSKVNAFKSAALALKGFEIWANKQAVESSNPARVGVERISGAGTGAATFEVTQLASAKQETHAFAVSGAARTFNFLSGGVTSSIEVGADATLDEVVSAINAKSDSPVFAAAVVPNGGGPAQLILSSRKTGAPGDFALDIDGAAQTPAYTKAAKQALFKVDGLDTDPATGTPYASDSNVVENAIPGLRLTLKSITTEPVSVTVGAPGIDKEAVKAKVKAFTDAYNNLIFATRSKVTEKSSPAGTTMNELTKGQLFGDNGLTSLLTNFRMRLGDDMGTAGDVFTSLRAIGVTTGKSSESGTKDPDAIAGKLQIDDAALMKALDTNPLDVKKLFDGPNGLAKVAEDLAAIQVGATGLIDGRLKSSVGEQKRVTDTIARTETRLEAKEKRLKAQFAAMEAAMASTQSQSAWLGAQISSFNR
jgi:flagellar hook-associated protein 2